MFEKAERVGAGRRTVMNRIMVHSAHRQAPVDIKVCFLGPARRLVNVQTATARDFRPQCLSPASVGVAGVNRHDHIPADLILNDPFLRPRFQAGPFHNATASSTGRSSVTISR